MPDMRIPKVTQLAQAFTSENLSFNGNELAPVAGDVRLDCGICVTSTDK